MGIMKQSTVRCQFSTIFFDEFARIATIAEHFLIVIVRGEIEAERGLGRQNFDPWEKCS